MAKVIVKDNNVEQAIKQLRKKIEQEGTLKKYKEKMYYKSKADKRREAYKSGRRKELKRMRKQALIDKRFD